MKLSEIKKIAAHAVTSAHQIISHWLPGGKLEGHEYIALNPKRTDSTPGSFSINTRTGEWADFATGDKGKDLVSLLAYLTDSTQSQAAEELAVFLGIPLERNDRSNQGKGDSKDGANGNASTQPKESPVVDSGKGSAGDGWVCVMPVPDDAPPPPQAHPKHGKYDQRYDYLNVDGKLNYYHDRWEAKEPDGKKQFAPLTLWQKGKRFKWQFKAPPVPRPLYGLPSLLQYPDAWVWIVEGEKAARALDKLLPDHPVLCWQGGSMAVDKSDFQTLQGRRVRIWPDNDQAGNKAAWELMDQLKRVEAAEAEVLNLERLALYKPAFVDTGEGSNPKIDRTGSANLKTGDDAHDLLMRDRWTADHFRLLLALNVPDLFLQGRQETTNREAQADIQNKQPDASVPDNKKEYQARFQVKEYGVLLLEQDKEGKPKYRKICGKLEVIAQTRDPNNGAWGKLVQFADPDNRLKRIIIPARAFNGEGLEATGRLLDEGLAIMPKARQLVLQYLQEQCPDDRARITDKTGWHEADDNPVFVLPDRFIGGTNNTDEWLFSAQKQENHFQQKGTLQDWTQHVASLCRSNSRLLFSVSTAFASPLLGILGLEGGGFHWRGGSSSGKSTCLQVAASVCGSRQYVERWRSTDNSLESVAQSHSDALLVLDELKELEARVAGETAYMLGNGSGKNRSNSDGSLRNKAKWRLLYLSSGELGLSDHVASVGKDAHAGMEIRLCDLPVDAGKGLGGFEELHSYKNGSEFSKALDALSRKYYGAAFLAFIEHILKDRQHIIDEWRDARSAFENNLLTESASGQARRVATRFALVGFAGELASQWQITGWSRGESMDAASRCFKDWLAGFGEGNREEHTMIAQVRRFLEAHGEGRFSRFESGDIDRSHLPRVINKAGYRKSTMDGVEYYVYPETFKREICHGLNYMEVAKLLISKGYMRPDGNHHKPKVDLPSEGRMRVYHILPNIMWGGDE